MSNPVDLFANVVDETIAARKQFTNNGPIDGQHKRGKNARQTTEQRESDESQSELKTAMALEVMRRENAEARADLKSTISTFQAENALFRETVRGFITTSQVENAQFREQFREGVASIKIDMAKQSNDIESKISNLKIWVLTGALSALVTALGMVGGALLKKENGSAAAEPAQVATTAAPTQPSVQVSLSGSLNSEPSKPQLSEQPAQQRQAEPQKPAEGPPLPAKP